MRPQYEGMKSGKTSAISASCLHFLQHGHMVICGEGNVGLPCPAWGLVVV